VAHTVFGNEYEYANRVVPSVDDEDYADDEDIADSGSGDDGVVEREALTLVPGTQTIHAEHLDTLPKWATVNEADKPMSEQKGRIRVNPECVLFCRLRRPNENFGIYNRGYIVCIGRVTLATHLRFDWPMPVPAHL
jgi:hypothetical protein